jgi:hypothetical protein
MIPTQIHNNIVRADTPAVYAYYIVKSNILYPLALVCDENDVLVGVMGSGEINSRRFDILRKNCGELCNRDFIYLVNSGEDALYGKARNIFAEKPLMALPIVDQDKIPIGLFGKFQAFFREMYKSLPYFSYAHGLVDAVKLAKSRDYKQISAIEFGVAGGRGLTHMEVYAKEISRLYGVGIDVYGFDSGNGLLPLTDFRDCPQLWIEGDYKLDFDALQSRLYEAKLIIGDICNTTKSFLSDCTPAPIGFISVDVDQYTPTVAILKMLLEDDKYFLPIVTMYFDDIMDQLEFQGETLAIKEFNESNKTMKISPEHTGLDAVWLTSEAKSTDWVKANQFAHLKWCNRFCHPRFSTPRTTNVALLI